MDADIAAMRRQLESARANPSSDATARAPIRELLSDAAATAPSLRHSAPEAFVPGQPLRIAIAADRTLPLAPARLFYRHVDQAEEYDSVELTRQDDELRAVIPGAYTASQYALQYFFELHDGRGGARRFPGFTSDRDNQPYFVVQTRS
jgi:hypothetical protein